MISFQRISKRLRNLTWICTIRVTQVLRLLLSSISRSAGGWPTDLNVSYKSGFLGCRKISNSHHKDKLFCKNFCNSVPEPWAGTTYWHGMSQKWERNGSLKTVNRATLIKCCDATSILPQSQCATFVVTKTTLPRLATTWYPVVIPSLTSHDPVWPRRSICR